LNCKLGRKITKLFDHGNSIKKHLRSYYNQKREIMRKVIQNTVFIEMMIQC
jgi:adenylylsulfate kinase-like enzyme